MALIYRARVLRQKPPSPRADSNPFQRHSVVHQPVWDVAGGQSPIRPAHQFTAVRNRPSHCSRPMPPPEEGGFDHYQIVWKMARVTGLEPATSGVTGRMVLL